MGRIRMTNPAPRYTIEPHGEDDAPVRYEVRCLSYGLLSSDFGSQLGLRSFSLGVFNSPDEARLAIDHFERFAAVAD